MELSSEDVQIVQYSPMTEDTLDVPTDTNNDIQPVNIENGSMQDLAKPATIVHSDLDFEKSENKGGEPLINNHCAVSSGCSSPLKSPSLCSVSQLSTVFIDNQLPTSHSFSSNMSNTSESCERVEEHECHDEEINSDKDELENKLLQNNHATTVDMHSSLDIQQCNVPRTRLQPPLDNSALYVFVFAVSYAVLSLIVLGPVMALLIAVVPIGYFIKRMMTSFCVCNSGPRCVGLSSCESIKAGDVYWLGDSMTSGSHVETVVLVKGNIQLDQVKTVVQNDLIDPYHAQKPFKRFMQRLWTLFAGYAWKIDDEFDIDNHIFLVPSHVVDKDSLEKYSAELCRRGLDCGKALWEIQVCPYFGGQDHSLLILRYSPCMIDGLTLMHVLCSELSENPDMTYFTTRQHMSAPLYTVNICRTFLSGALVFLELLFRKRNENYFSLKELSGENRVAFSEKFSMQAIQRIRQVTRCSFSEVLLCALSGSLRLYLQSLGADNPCDIQAVIPIDLHSHYGSIKTVNKTVLVPILLPVSTEAAIPRLWDIKSRMEELRNSSEAVVLYSAWCILIAMMPHSLCRRIFRVLNNKSTFLISNLPGPNQHAAIHAMPVRSVLHSVTPFDQLGFSVSFTSYADEVHMTVVADKNVIPNPAKLNHFFCRQLLQLSDLLSSRRIPGDSYIRNLDFPSHLANTPEIQEAQLRLGGIQNKLHDMKCRLTAVSNGESDEDEELLSLNFRALRNEFHTIVGHLRHLQMVHSSPDFIPPIVGETSPETSSVDGYASDASGLCSSTTRPLVSVTRPHPVLTHHRNRAKSLVPSLTVEEYEAMDMDTARKRAYSKTSPLEVLPCTTETCDPLIFADNKHAENNKLTDCNINEEVSPSDEEAIQTTADTSEVQSKHVHKHKKSKSARRSSYSPQVERKYNELN